MERGREQTLLVLAVVIALHAGGLVALVGTRLATADSDVVTVAAAPPTRTAPAPPIQPPPPEVEPEPEVDLNALGEAAGTGNSIASVDLPEVSRSPQPSDLEQAWMRREPTVAPPPAPPVNAAVAGSSTPTPQTSTEPQANSDAAAMAQLNEARPTLPFGSVPVPAGESDRTQQGMESESQTAEESTATALADATPARDAISTEPAPGQAAIAEQPPMQSPTPPNANAVSSNTAAATPAPEQPSDPAPQGQNDLDAFAQAEGVDFQRGGVQARRGRETKLVRPRIDLSFMADATRLSGRDLIVKLRIATDATGKPRRVEVAESSGSETIDNAVRLAMYDSWFGGRMPDEFPFQVRFVSR